MDEIRPKLNQYEMAIIQQLVRRAEQHAFYRQFNEKRTNATHAAQYDALYELNRRLNSDGRRRVRAAVDLGDLTIPAEKRLL